jgi:hypothetical protein
LNVTSALTAVVNPDAVRCAYTEHVPAATAVTTPAPVTVQIVGLLLRKLVVPVVAPPDIVRVAVLPTSRLAGTETVIADWVANVTVAGVGAGVETVAAVIVNVRVIGVAAA